MRNLAALPSPTFLKGRGVGLYGKGLATPSLAGSGHTVGTWGRRCGWRASQSGRCRLGLCSRYPPACSSPALPRPSRSSLPPSLLPSLPSLLPSVPPSLLSFSNSLGSDT